jgi:hypothetical protein
MFPNTVIGQVTATGNAINVVLGFKPDKVRVVRVSNGAELQRFRGQTGMLIAASGARTVQAGITDYEGTEGEGFTIPATAAVNANGEVLMYEAVRSAPGAQ